MVQHYTTTTTASWDVVVDDVAAQCCGRGCRVVDAVVWTEERTRTDTSDNTYCLRVCVCVLVELLDFVMRGGCSRIRHDFATLSGCTVVPKARARITLQGKQNPTPVAVFTIELYYIHCTAHYYVWMVVCVERGMISLMCVLLELMLLDVDVICCVVVRQVWPTTLRRHVERGRG